MTLTAVRDSDTLPNGAVNGIHQAAYQYDRVFLGKPRKMRIVVIGAGLSGIAAVKLFKDRFEKPNHPVELTIYEKNSDVGGTWLENRYPGCACDVPAHSYTFSWEGNPRWSQAYVTSPEIFDYYQGRAKAYGVYDHVHLDHRVKKASWNDDRGKWQMEIADNSGNTLQDEADVLINATGFLNQWKWPNVKGLQTFQGHLVHSARWDDNYDFNGKQIAVIGNGSSAIQIVPKLQPGASQLISFNRSPTWITPEFAAELIPKGRDTRFSQQQQDQWASDPELFLAYRKHVEHTMNKIFDIQFKHSETQKTVFQKFRETMRERLGNKASTLAPKLIPEFAVGCRRLTPGHGYLEALAAENVTVECGQILKVHPQGLEMEDGTLYEVDVIVCATGFDTSFRPAFPVIGENGIDLRDSWAEEPRSYLSVAASGFPNFFFASGPNFTLANGTLVPCLEKCITYAFDAISKMQTQGIKSMSPKVEAIDEFQEHKDSIMKDLVWSSGCRSWYKLGTVDGKVWGPWPGSSLHFLDIMSQPRWEDWNIKYMSKNRFAYFGNGMTEIEMSGGDLTWYLTQEGVEQ